MLNYFLISLVDFDKKAFKVFVLFTMATRFLKALKSLNNFDRTIQGSFLEHPMITIEDLT